jgi:alpha-L-rhamnosidase
MMKSILLLIYLVFMILPRGGKSPEAPYGLMVEFIRDTEGVSILDSRPEFSWIVPRKAEHQTAYQIILSSSRGKIIKSDADVWNSKKVFSSSSTETEYSGTSLSENTLYFWKVRVWNKKGKPSRWSGINFFRTGKFNGYRTSPNKFIETRAEPVRLSRTGESSFFADFGNDAFGTLDLYFSPPVKDTLIVMIGEKCAGTDKIDSLPGGTIRFSRVLIPVEPGKTTYSLKLDPDERNTGEAAIKLPDSLGVITPFRYCEIHNCNSDLKTENLVRRSYSYYFDDNASYFESSDTILNKIWDLCKYSIKATSFAGIYIDGDRERIPYEADAYINQLGHYYTDREYSIARLTAEYFITHPTWPTEWILQTVPLFYNDLMYTGNYESVIYYYPRLKYKMLNELARKDGLISSAKVTDTIMINLGFSNSAERIRDIIDWPPAQKDTGWKLATPSGERDGYDMVDVNTVVNAFYYNNLILMSEIAGYIGRKVDSVLYRARAVKVKESFNRIFLDNDRGYYVDGESSEHSSLHANMMALAFDLVPDEYKKSVIEFIKSRQMACSVYGAQYLLEGLYKAMESGYAMSLLTATNDRSWWNMIRSGSTISMEAWDLKYKPNSDWNHAWGSAPANIIPGYLWGIRPVMPGYSRAVIRPQLDRLTFSNIKVPTIRGTISAVFNDNGKSKEYTITLPSNMECDFVLSDAREKLVIYNGKKLKIVDGIIKLHAGTNKIIL